MTINKKQLIEEWHQSFFDMPETEKLIADWWLSKFDSYKKELEEKFNKRFRYSLGKPMEGSLELTHNNVRDFLKVINNQDEIK